MCVCVLYVYVSMCVYIYACVCIAAARLCVYTQAANNMAHELTITVKIIGVETIPVTEGSSSSGKVK